MKTSMPAGTGVCVVKTFPLVARFAGLGEREVLFLHEPADLLEGHEGRVALVDVANRRPELELLEGARAADAQHDLLLEAHLMAAAVETGGDLAVGSVVFRKVRVEEQDRNAADLGHPDQEVHVPPGEVHRNDGRLPSGVSAIESGSSSGSSTGYASDWRPSLLRTCRK